MPTGIILPQTAQSSTGEKIKSPGFSQQFSFWEKMVLSSLVKLEN